jgi:hypothetical protein
VVFGEQVDASVYRVDIWRDGVEFAGKAPQFLFVNPTLISTQDQLPGATILGTVLSSDKTQLTAMTDNRQSHPFLISLADLDMDFRLLALLPIAKFIEKNPEIAGVPVSRLFHSILDFILSL